jgi:hypothetical protein
MHEIITDPKQTAYLSSLLPSLFDDMSVTGPRPEVRDKRTDQDIKKQPIKYAMNSSVNPCPRPSTDVSSLDLHPWHRQHGQNSILARPAFSKSIHSKNQKTGTNSGYDTIEQTQVNKMRVWAHLEHQKNATEILSEIDAERRVLNFDDAKLDLIESHRKTTDLANEPIAETKSEHKVQAPIKQNKVTKTSRTLKPRAPLHLPKRVQKQIPYAPTPDTGISRTYIHAIPNHPEMTLPESRILNTVTGMPLNALERVFISYFKIR